eukprot:scaffold47_cov258-Pinguiococcus_pyrenoidosus.AAC.69
MVKLEFAYEDGRRESLAALRQRVQSSREEVLQVLRKAKICVEKPPEPETKVWRIAPGKGQRDTRANERGSCSGVDSTGAMLACDFHRCDERPPKLVQNVAHGSGQTPERAVVLNTHMSIGMNMIAGMGTMFFVGYIASRTMFTDAIWHMVGGLVGCVLMMIIEMTLYISRLYGLENAPNVAEADASEARPSTSAEEKSAEAGESGGTKSKLKKQ